LVRRIEAKHRKRDFQILSAQTRENGACGCGATGLDFDLLLEI
jgi:hypothetical protein